MGQGAASQIRLQYRPSALELVAWQTNRARKCAQYPNLPLVSPFSFSFFFGTPFCIAARKARVVFVFSSTAVGCGVGLFAPHFPFFKFRSSLSLSLSHSLSAKGKEKVTGQHLPSQTWSFFSIDTSHACRRSQPITCPRFFFSLSLFLLFRSSLQILRL
ncbi:hypothetical protein BCV70DRAFT_99658 [Testicularia cyperi]|uniref:Transmembrane protein n=1 Tax=Testicularia cyperi TaxID=1882483 RepID=A0A317XQW1_9BASI|nr:hypothetical protein BCV70DRAFT_99658 [Testicularia cyperi]